MPPIILWPSLILSGSFAIFFSAASLIWIADRLGLTRAPGEAPEPVADFAKTASIAVVSWLLVYRILNRA